METKELRIQVPEGYEIDKEKSTFENIVFKKKEEKRWRDDKNATLKGYYYIGSISGKVVQRTGICYNVEENYNLFTTEKYAKSAIAMARISQIMANDKRFGEPVTDKEWSDTIGFKYCICRRGNTIITNAYYEAYEFLAFHTKEQCDLFLKENMDLIKDYLMID